MILVNGFLQLRPGDIDAMRPALYRQLTIAKQLDGCLHYAFAEDIEDSSRLRIAERWRDRATQSAHMIGNHMAEFNIAMRTASVSKGELDAYEDGMVRKILEIPGARFRPERAEMDMVIVMGTIRFVDGEFDRLMPEMIEQVAITRSEDGCELYAFARDILDPEMLHIAERWRDQTALETHFTAPNTIAFSAALATAQIESINVNAYNATHERVLMHR